ncbi:hypothetical protein ACFFWD_04150 [Bradyrhizobium erythrophlei]|uniref:hypothetical protein n=1 Tax=Bradyrhizobium erythrophlei TaxID=1437360 RepID=UPI0035EDBA18
MTDHSDHRLGAGAIADAIQTSAKRTIAVQSDISDRLIEANRRWLELIQIEFTAAWELFRKLNSTVSGAEKITIWQDWMKGVTARGAEELTYAVETAQALNSIELNWLGRRTGDAADNTQKAA